jgi:hypothetical protein
MLSLHRKEDARNGAVREHRDLAEASQLNRAAVLLLQQFAHALVRRRIVLLQDEIGDRPDNTVTREVPCPGRRRNHCPDDETGRSNRAPHARAPYRQG